MDVHARLAEAVGYDGERVTMYPELTAPSSASTSGILPTIPVGELFVEEMMSSGEFKVLLVSCD